MLEIGERISHYRIIRRLDEGGTGEVYLAEDTRLARHVAMKFLPASYQYDPERHQRFLKETSAASTLRSPHIVAIFDIGKHEDHIYIVTEYAEGETLSSRAARGPLPVSEAVEIALQAANGLDEAHSRSVLHRELSSSKLIVTGRGLVKILGFGIARIREGEEGRPKDPGDRTVPLGQATTYSLEERTASYLSPEQALDFSLDHRSDIFSFGVVMFEMLTGRLPFPGETASEVVDKILHLDAPSLSYANPGVPAELDRIVRKCLEKDRAWRYQSARELLIDLRNLQRDSDSGTRQPAAQAKQTRVLRKGRSRKVIDSIAVLPLANESANPKAEYVADGITEGIINNLSQIPKLKVMARSTVFRYKGKQTDPLAAGRELDVRAVLAGRVLQLSHQLIIKMELVDVGDGSHLWGEQYNREFSDMAEIEEEISKEISAKLRVRLTGEERKRLVKRGTENSDAYQAYLKGRFFWNKHTEDGLKKGIYYFTEAVRADPNYAEAYAGITDYYNRVGVWGALAPKQSFSRAMTVAAKALAINDTLAEAHTSLAFAKWAHDWDWAGAEKGFKRALELNPSYVTALQWYSNLTLAMGRYDEAMAMVKRSYELDPLSPFVNVSMAFTLFNLRRYEEATEYCYKSLELDPRYYIAQQGLGWCYTQRGMHEKAIEELEKAADLFGGLPLILWTLGHAYAAAGRRNDAQAALEKLNAISKQRYISPYYTAHIHTALGNLDEAFNCLEKAYEERDWWLIWLKVEPRIDSLRSDPRYADLLRCVGL